MKEVMVMVMNRGLFIYCNVSVSQYYNDDKKEERYVQIGTLHGSVRSCSNRFPGIYARLEDPYIFAFITNDRRQK